MCILTFLKPGIAPDLDALHGGALANPHGHGYAIHTGAEILTGHGMDPDHVITEFAELRAKHPGGPALFHSRLATHGLRETANCHPFLVGGDPRTVLAHNGVLPDTVHPTAADPRSDTRIAAEDFLPTRPFGSLDTWQGRERFERWMAASKIVLLTTDPAYKHPAYIFNEQQGHWVGGIWYSNDSYLFTDWATADNDYLGFCLDCGTLDEDPLGPHCGYCGFCADLSLSTSRRIILLTSLFFFLIDKYLTNRNGYLCCGRKCSIDIF